jgi:hypothetical protein
MIRHSLDVYATIYATDLTRQFLEVGSDGTGQVNPIFMIETQIYKHAIDKTPNSMDISQILIILLAHR